MSDLREGVLRGALTAEGVITVGLFPEEAKLVRDGLRMLQSEVKKRLHRVLNDAALGNKSETTRERADRAMEEITKAAAHYDSVGCTLGFFQRIVEDEDDE